MSDRQNRYKQLIVEKTEGIKVHLRFIPIKMGAYEAFHIIVTRKGSPMRCFKAIIPSNEEHWETGQRNVVRRVEGICEEV